MQFILGFLVIYLICFILERIALFCDFSLPQIQEKSYKKQVFNKYKITTTREILDLKRKNLAELEQRAKFFALRAIAPYKDLTNVELQTLYAANYQYYYDKHKYLYS